MLTRNSNIITNDIKVEQSTDVKKRRHSETVDTNNTSEPFKKHRKLRNSKHENDENKSEDILLHDIFNNDTSEFKDFIKHFSIPSNIYKYLSIRSKLNPVMLQRCLSYNKSMHHNFPKTDIHSIADHLSAVRLHDENIPLIKGKKQNIIKFQVPKEIIIKFEQFQDSQNEKNWQTLEAHIYVDIVHIYRDNRKNKDGFSTNRVINKHKISINHPGPESNEKYVIDIDEIMSNATNYRVYKIMLHFKILATEKKLFSKNISQEKKSDELYPVTYEAMMPLYSNKDERHMYKETYFIENGKYEILPKTTNMEMCDDSPFSGVLSDPEKDELDCYWINTDDLQTDIKENENCKLIFSISTEDVTKVIQKPLKARNKNLQPVVTLSPMKNRDLCLSSIIKKVKSTIDVNLAFKFLINDRVVQWTQTRHLSCPWCLVNFQFVTDLFSTLEKMLQHLNYQHSKFTFTCKRLSSRASFAKSLSKKFVTVDVSLTPISVSDSDIGLMLVDRFPTRRTPVTEVIHTKFEHPTANLYREHHKRDYCHTWSSRRNKYIEFDIDSEAEENMGWMFDHYHRKVEEFSDLNHIEKRVIQIWNESLLKYGYNIGDAQMKNFIEHFIGDVCENREKLTEVAQLRNTLMLHLVNLIDFGVLPPAIMLRSMKTLDDAIAALDQ